MLNKMNAVKETYNAYIEHAKELQNLFVAICNKIKDICPSLSEEEIVQLAFQHEYYISEREKVMRIYDKFLELQAEFKEEYGVKIF